MTPSPYWPRLPPAAPLGDFERGFLETHHFRSPKILNTYSYEYWTWFKHGGHPQRVRQDFGTYIPSLNSCFGELSPQLYLM